MQVKVKICKRQGVKQFFFLVSESWVFDQQAFLRKACKPQKSAATAHVVEFEPSKHAMPE